jgi:lysozyme family protein
MANNFDQLIEQVIGIEGGVSDRPLKDDPGGLTKYGVTQTTYDRWRNIKGLPPKTVREITRPEVIAIAKANYWAPVHGDKLPGGVDFAVFDYAYNSGPAQAVKDLQRALGVTPDGAVGLATLEALAVCDAEAVINGICDRRLAFMRKLKNWKANANGWTNRVAHVRAQSLALAAGQDTDQPDIALTSMPIGKANPPTPVPAKKSGTVWAAIGTFVSGALVAVGNFLAQIPDFAHTALNAINPFAEKSELAQVISNGIAGAGAIAAAYVAWNVIKKKNEDAR